MDTLNYLRFQNLYVIPTFHSRIEFARIVRRAIFDVFPEVIALELPANVRNEVNEAINRLPFLSIIGYADSLNPTSMNFVPIDPGDSIIEAVRVGQKFHIPVEFIDLSVKDYVPPPFELPDDHAIAEIGLKRFYEEISEQFGREYQAQKRSIRDTITLESYLLQLDEVGQQEAGDEEKENEGELGESEDNFEFQFGFVEKDVLREKYMASRLQMLMNSNHRVLFVVGMAHWDNIKYFLEHPDLLEEVHTDLIPHKFIKIYNIESSDARFLLKELPYHTHQWNVFRNEYPKAVLEQCETPEELAEILKSYRRIDHLRTIFLEAKDEYEEEYKEFIDLHKLKTLFQYVRNIALIEKRLLPSLYHLLVAAKNVVDDDYAWEVFDKATMYPYNDTSEQYETMKLSTEGGIDPEGRYVRLRRNHPYRYGKDNKGIPMRERPKEKYPGEWRDEWEENQWNTVSWPPEDIIEEDYFAFIRQKTIKNLKNQRVQIEEFRSSLMDGIAIKETIRNWAYEKKIYVRNEQQIQGKIDTIVVIFDEDVREPEKYPFKITWWAEHDKESDMAFYSTFPGDYLIGPGISHVEIGGLLSIFPPINIQDVFSYYNDYLYRDTDTKAERLLRAAIMYSNEKYIAYVAPNPPRKYFSSLAGVKHREIVYIPLDIFSKESLKTIKHVHLLAGRDKRDIADQYIFL